MPWWILLDIWLILWFFFWFLVGCWDIFCLGFNSVWALACFWSRRRWLWGFLYRLEKGVPCWLLLFDRLDVPGCIGWSLRDLTIVRWWTNRSWFDHFTTALLSIFHIFCRQIGWFIGRFFRVDFLFLFCWRRLSRYRSTRWVWGICLRYLFLRIFYHPILRECWCKWSCLHVYSIAQN